MRFTHLFLLFTIMAAPAQAAPEALTVAEWRADLRELVTTIRERHYRPWTFISEEAFMERAGTLEAGIPALTDAEIIAEMVGLTAMLQDGHTRLSIPRQHREAAHILEFGHAGTPPPNDSRLQFAALPVVFEMFDDGLYVVAATPQHAGLVGRRVLGIGNMAVDDAIAAVRPASFAENEAAACFWAPDRLSLPALLAALGITESAAQTRITYACETGRCEHLLKPLPPTPVRWTEGRLPPWTGVSGEKFSSRFLRDGRALYIRITELELQPPIPHSDRLLQLLTEAEERKTERLIIDLRHNIGGSASWNAVFVRAFLQSDFNRFGRLYVLTGRQTFSAAALLVQDFEEFLDAIYVGEETGAKPGHFGDPDRIELSNSGLTLRVSTRFHSGPFGSDFNRSSNPAYITVPYAYDDFVDSGTDRALEAALDFEAPETLSGQVEWLIREGHLEEAIIHYFRHLSDPLRNSRDSVEEMVTLGHSLLDDGLDLPGYFLFAVMSDFLPGEAQAHAGRARALEMRGAADDALHFYRRALELDPQNGTALAGLERLEN